MDSGIDWNAHDLYCSLEGIRARHCHFLRFEIIFDRVAGDRICGALFHQLGYCCLYCVFELEPIQFRNRLSVARLVDLRNSHCIDEGEYAAQWLIARRLLKLFDTKRALRELLMLWTPWVLRNALCMSPLSFEMWSLFITDDEEKLLIIGWHVWRRRDTRF